ncbi:unnamed protein product [Soboliphyme baturini]|uniref:Integrator complex subunit 2 n=1 Tax=Soboliphyme baturini TaxID=241478 RepID=A0A183IVX0_9BILA|nr:unnamed protein product [Soboliphyme baturini]
MNPDCVTEIISQCVNLKKLPMLMVSLVVDCCSFRTLATLLSSILLDEKFYGRSWFTRFVHASQKASADEMLRDTLMNLKARINSEIKTLLVKCRASHDETLTCYDAQQSADVIRLCFQLKYTGGWRFSEEELKFIVHLICSKVVYSAAGTQYICVSLVSLVALSSIVPNTGFDELMLMLAVNLYTGQIQRLQRLASSVLSLKISLHSSNLNTMKNFLIDRIFSDSRWIFDQLTECTTPVHKDIPSLIQVYADSCFHQYQKSSIEYPSTDGPLAEENIKSLFLTDVFRETEITCRILFLYYLLYYQELLFKNLPAIAASNSSALVTEYSHNLFSVIPVFYLVTYVDKHAVDYSVLHASLMGLAKTRYPYFFSTHCSSFYEFLSDSDTTAVDLPKKHEVSCSLKRASSHSAYCILMLKKLLTLPLPLLVPYLDTITSSLLCLLKPSVPRKVLMLVAAIWDRLEFMSPWQLYCSTMWFLLDADCRKSRSSQAMVDHKELREDILLILRCDRRVYRCPIVLQMVLRILHCYMFESRFYYESAFKAVPPQPYPIDVEATNSTAFPTMNEVERNNFMLSLISSQESSAVLILLEICLPNTRERKRSGPFNVLSEIRDTVCSFLHSLFISDPLLIKLIHFQGYSDELIPMTVSRIPSMHICLDFIPELFAHGDRQKLIFAMKLLSTLCKQYAVPKAFACANLAVDVLSTLIQVLPSAEVVQLFHEILPSCFDFSRSFPPLADEIALLLVDVRKLVSARISCQKLIVPSIDTSSPSSADVRSLLKLQSKEASLLLRLKRGFEENLCHSLTKIAS